jgi:hypothetical protein
LDEVFVFFDFDDSFDKNFLVDWASEGYYIIFLRVVEEVGEAVDEDGVPCFEGWVHAVAGDLEFLEGEDEEKKFFNKFFYHFLLTVYLK